jgi:hypothetical protein
MPGGGRGTRSSEKFGGNRAFLEWIRGWVSDGAKKQPFEVLIERLF